MQLSRDEFLRVSVLREARNQGGLATASPYGNFATAPAPRPATGEPTVTPEARRIVDNMDEMPEVRDEIVASLRARIESGTYQVSGEAIAEMMLRRMMADRTV